MELDIALIMVQLAEKFPVVSTILMLVGGLRLVFKPIMAIIESVIAYTPYDSDDKALANVKKSKAYTFLAWFVDWSASVKLPVKK
jgi:hypothetical protein